MYAILKHQLRETIINFPDELLPKKREKYGDLLQVCTGNAPLPPAAEARTVPTLAQRELPKVQKKRGPARTGTGCGQNGAKPVVNITTGTYYPSARVAALAIGVNPSGISQRLSDKARDQFMDGNVFRFATSTEQQQEKYIQSDSDALLAAPLIRENPTAKPVVSITTGTYYPSIMDAGKAIDSIPIAITQHLNGSGSATRKSVKGQKFRFATLDEIAIKQYIKLIEQ